MSQIQMTPMPAGWHLYSEKAHGRIMAMATHTLDHEECEWADLEYVGAYLVAQESGQPVWVTDMTARISWIGLEP